MSDYKKELRHRLLQGGIPTWFIEVFFERNRGSDMERDLRDAANVSPEHYEDMLLSWVETAKNDYYHYGPGWSGHVQEGDILPKKTPQKKRRGQKAKDIADTWERQAALG